MDFRAALAQFDIDPMAANAAAEDFAAMIASEYGANPSEYWECQKTGAYKECYFVDNVAVKFALECNETLSREEPIYAKALARSLDAAFAHTIFLPLEKRLPAYFVGCEDDNEEPEKFDCVILQEKIGDILGYRDSYHAILWYDDKKSYGLYPLTCNGTIIPYETIEPLIQVFCYQEWIQAGINFYGLKFMLELTNFCNEMRVDDLHQYNLGFRADGSPLIFDFIS